MPARKKVEQRFTQVRLILGDQLNASHSWFSRKDPDVLYVMAELNQELTYTRHHIQKVVAFFLAMRNFASALAKSGHTVHYFSLDDTADFKDLNDWLSVLLSEYPEASFEYQQPDEYRVSEQLKSLSRSLDRPVVCADSEHFFVPFNELGDYFKKDHAHKMEAFYRKVRSRFKVLMSGDKPEGGQWNYDKENRKSLKKDDIEQLVEPKQFRNDASEVIALIEKHGIETIGSIEDRSGKAAIGWPVTRTQAKELLAFFIENCLPHFGDFQDAMTCQSPHRWSLYHSRLAFALNTKMLKPEFVVREVEKAYYEAKGALPLAGVEGFIRQILGWREFVRGIYWLNMPDYTQKNALKASRALPDYFWSGKTNMRCMHEAISQSLEQAYAHHIQRLTVTGSFCLMAGIDPDEVEQWYLGIYIDALEWVESPNTRGMALFADDGLLATKPYAVSGNYMSKMSDYCKHCHYNVKAKTGEGACPFNSFYWNFIDTHQKRLLANPRTAMIARAWSKKPDEEKAAIVKQAEQYLKRINTL